MGPGKPNSEQSQASNYSRFNGGSIQSAGGRETEYRGEGKRRKTIEVSPLLHLASSNELLQTQFRSLHRSSEMPRLPVRISQRGPSPVPAVAAHHQSEAQVGEEPGPRPRHRRRDGPESCLPPQGRHQAVLHWLSHRKVGR